MGPSFIILAALCLAGVSGIEWKNLYVKWDILDGYFKMPLLQEELLKGTYTYMAFDQDLNVTFYSLPGDPRVSFGFDIYGNIAAIRTGYIKKDVVARAESKSLTFPTSLYDNNKMYGSDTYWNKELWYNTVLFVSPQQLKTGGRTETKGLVGENVYVKLNGEWQEVPRKQTDAESKGFHEQACFVGMGKHYFYGLTKEGTCEDAPGVFLLYESGEMIGLGLIPYGSFTNGDQKSWFEDPPAVAAKMIAPNSPDCMGEWITNYGTTSLHIFFKAHPRLTFCLGEENQSKTNQEPIYSYMFPYIKI